MDNLDNFGHANNAYRPVALGVALTLVRMASSNAAYLAKCCVGVFSALKMDYGLGLQINLVENYRHSHSMVWHSSSVQRPIKFAEGEMDGAPSKMAVGCCLC